MVSQRERSEATRQSLIAAGRELFAQRGYADVSVAEVAKLAGVSTGPIYHQFESKQGLFAAIYEGLVALTWERVLAARETAREPGVLSDCEAYLDACADPTYFRITADGPAVIGWDGLIDGTRRMIEASLNSARERGEIVEVPIAPLARMLAAALKEAGVIIATAEDPALARKQASETTRSLIRGLLAGKK